MTNASTRPTVASNPFQPPTGTTNERRIRFTTGRGETSNLRSIDKKLLGQTANAVDTNPAVRPLCDRELVSLLRRNPQRNQ